MKPIVYIIDREISPTWQCVQVTDETGSILTNAEDIPYESDSATTVIRLLVAMEKTGAIRLIATNKVRAQWRTLFPFPPDTSAPAVDFPGRVNKPQDVASNGASGI
jgi:hypothetical protein